MEHISNKEVGDNEPEVETLPQTAPVLPKISPVSGSWRPNIDEYYNDRTTGKQAVRSIPFHESEIAKKLYSKKQRKAMEVVYNYLKSHRAFQNAANVKKGSTVYFVVDRTLIQELREKTKDDSTFIILMAADPEGKTIIGNQAINLPSENFDSFNSYGIAEQYNRT